MNNGQPACGAQRTAIPRLSIWNSGKRGADFNFLDHDISEWFGVGDGAVYVHPYLGPYDQTGDTAIDSVPAYTPGATATNPPAPPTALSVQDVRFRENRDRKYGDTVYELRGVYNVLDVDFDMRQFGLFLTNDTLFIESSEGDWRAIISF